MPTLAPMKLAIIGAGAAGFFCATELRILNKSIDIVIFDSAELALRKVKVSGGGRCNLTNSFENIEGIASAYPRGNQLMKRLFKSFNHRDAYEWFEDRGIRLYTNDEECVFPRSESSQEIIDMFTDFARSNNIRLVLSTKITDIKQQETSYLISTKNGEEYPFDYVLVSTGGSPSIKGLSFLKNLSLELNPPSPSLFGFKVENSITELSGIVVPNTILSLQGTGIKSEGDLLITHWGLSGPAVLKLSSYASKELSEAKYNSAFSINWCGEKNYDIVSQKLKKEISEAQKKQIQSIKCFKLSSRVWAHILRRAGIETGKRCSEIGSKTINKLVNTLINDTYDICGRASHKEEFVTCGGVSLQSIKAANLEAKDHPNLYFAGEVLDVDGITGGFNLQAAWTTGYVVAHSINNSIGK